MSIPWIIDFTKDEEGFAGVRESGVFGDLNADPIYGNFGQSYFPAVFDSRLTPCSFIVGLSGDASLLVECNILDGQLNRFGFPVRLITRFGIPASECERALQAAVKHLIELAKRHGASEVRLEDPYGNGFPSPIGQACLSRGGAPSLRVHALVDLHLSEIDLHRHVRKSYTSLINRGRRSLKLVHVNAENADQQLFQSYQDFHRKIAGRITRPQASWDSMFQHIVKGCGELTLAYLENGELVSALVVVEGTETASYVSAVYDRQRFDLPLAHWPLYNAILRCQSRKLRRFELGEIPFKTGATEKEYNIGQFKKGFASQLTYRLQWTMRTAK